MEEDRSKWHSFVFMICGLIGGGVLLVVSELFGWVSL